MKSKDVKQEQLGMNPGTASHRLVKDILFSLIKDTPCSKCGGILTRDTFSIEHKIPWLHSENPKELFFDLENITYSHLICNIKDARQLRTRESDIIYNKRYYEKLDPEIRKQRRRDQYLRTGK